MSDLPILGHEKALHLLERAAARPASGYLFSGSNGLGKQLVAQWFAARLLSVEFGQLAAHPDFLLLKREEGDKNIKVEAVKEAVSRMSLTAAAGGCKVALMDGAEALREDATNALLKSVEEPSGRAVYLFVTEQPDRLPATLRSRLVHLAFSPVPTDKIRDWLAASGIESKLAAAAAAASRGAPGLASRLAAEPELWRKRRTEAAELLRVLAEEKIGRQLGELERLAKRLNAEPDPENAWRVFTGECTRQAGEAYAHRPEVMARIGRGLVRAQILAGGPLSPHLALEWAVVEPYHVGDAPSFLHPSYL